MKSRHLSVNLESNASEDCFLRSPNVAAKNDLKAVAAMGGSSDSFVSIDSQDMKQEMKRCSMRKKNKSQFDFEDM